MGVFHAVWLYASTLPPQTNAFPGLIGALFQKTQDTQQLEQSNHWFELDFLPVPITPDVSPGAASSW